MNLIEVRQASANQVQPFPSVKSTTLKSNFATPIVLAALCCIGRHRSVHGFETEQLIIPDIVELDQNTPKHNVIVPYQTHTYILRVDILSTTA